MNLVYPAIFYADDESSAYAVVVPDLPGCVSGGNSLSEAIAMGEDAASGW
ncbi:MAG: type II toxin-antitoxin system HicB family antitoxin, partial [Selenomonas sp.]|nr:type II toxin-antitoxin system HicB family antitoxin [Selenomonas sp.]